MIQLPMPEYDMWDRLRTRSLPLYLYGTGDGADKILGVFAAKGITIDGIFVSDDFYRGQSFHDIRVRPLSTAMQAEERYIIAVAFGSHLPEIMQRVCRIGERHELLIPDVPIAGGEIFDLSYYRAHLAELTETMQLLEDEISRKVLADVAEYKLTGSLMPLLRCVSDKEEVYSVLLPLRSGEHYIDCGAYRGDTVQEFLAHLPDRDVYGSVTAFEPDSRSCRCLRAAVDGLERVTVYEGGVSDRSGISYAEDNRGRGTSFLHARTMTQLTGFQSAVKGKTVSMYRIDDLHLQPTCLKMDVEGYEKKALEGAAETIRCCSPKLQIACYHRSEDLFILPRLIKTLQPAYRLYLRRHACFPCWELNLYAACEGG